MTGRPERQRMTRRRFLGTAATALGGLSLASCAGWTTPGSEIGANDDSNPNVITVWFWDDSLQFAVDEFHKVQNRIRVYFQKIGFDDAHQKLLTSFAAGAGAPDVCSLEIGLIGGFTGRGGLVNLRDAPFNADRFKDDIVEYKWVQGSTEDGRLLAMPWDIGPAGLWYHVDMLKAAGIETDPERMQARIGTWDDWFQLAEDLKKRTPKTALFADAYNDVLIPMIEQQGHGWFDGDKLVVVEKATEPLRVASRVHERGLDANITWWGAEWATGLRRNAFAGMGIASWMQGGLAREHPQTIGKWRVIRAPGGDYNWGGSFMGIPEQSRKKESAWEFLRFVCCDARGQNAIFKQSGIYPAYRPAWEDPYYDQPVEFFGGQRTYRLWAEIAEGVPANVVHRADRQVNDLVNNEITKVRNQGKDPAQATRDAEAAALDRIRDITA